ncbi:NAD-dependent epimerase/dehydratase family protein [Planomicrobium sp. YIM 101495]|uniref:polysaccharide biosynthesis C-terminal domain-containing protein n=1 Tax=Planomicrobium sp. YIM 101495 TaxID=2665160 RepID=UPI0012B845D4|nr:NAD-dependent epimerase/dehydratase family protein [Planomicrobium sp. YIM 101495]MTD30772.1 NAD-dependent epimerase/dehydratase family protein [Planomicrobium sp. YIM 101495]
MKILVTGANGFVGKNLVAELHNKGFSDLQLFTREHSLEDLERFAANSDFVFHLAGTNRPQNESEFMEGNYELTAQLLSFLKKHKNKAHVLVTSSIQAQNENPYGASKKSGEDSVFAHGQETGAAVYVYRLPNLFGKWSKPNYNTVVATYCHNIARGLEIQVNNPDAELTLSYIDDVLKEFLNALAGTPTRSGEYCEVPVTHKIKLGELAQTINSFKESRTNLEVSNLGDPLTKKLYSTYLSFLPEDEFSYKLKMNKDNRGSFTEFLRTPDRGQVSVNISKPGITKGNHWHHTKNEKFLVVCGKGVIRFRKVDSNEVIEYFVDGESLEIVDIPVGYTHNIENLGESDMVTVMWANESFDPDNPDTYFVEV